MIAAETAVDVVPDFEPITLEELNLTAALQRRVDHKYVVDADTFTKLAHALRPTHRILAIDGLRSFQYHTVYFDSHSLASYRSHIQGRRRRFKCRCRHYVDTHRFTFEVKFKGRRGLTVKKQLRYSEAHNGQMTEEARQFLRATLRDAYGDDLDEPFFPVLETAYRRITLAAREDSERVTCDFDLAFASTDGQRFEMATDHLIVESKSLHGAGAADRALRSLGARPVAISKYIVGASLIRPDVTRSNEFRRVLRRHFGWSDSNASRSPAR